MKSILLMLFIPLIIFSQVKRIITTDGNMFELPEVGAMLIEDGGKLKVDMIMPSSNRPKQYKDVDIKTGDFVLMMNGKKMENTDKAKELYEKLKPGDEVKLGIKRGEEMFISGFKKADPKDLPKVQRMIIKNDIVADGTVVLPDDGLLIGIQKGNAVITKKLPRGDNNIKEGDQITEINGKAVNEGKDFTSYFKSLKPGDKLELRFKSGLSLKTKKPENKGNVIIKETK